MGRTYEDAAPSIVMAGLLLAGCGDDGSSLPRPGTTSAGSSTGSLTTFESTVVDPSDPTTSDEGSTVDPSEDTTADTGSSSGEPTGATDTSSGGDEAPTVMSTTPADLESGVPAATEISVEFSEPMDPATITTNTADGSCSGSLQVSTDGFVTCVPMAAAPATGDNLSFTVTAAAPLDSATTYQIRVLASVTDAGGTPMVADFTTGTGFIVRYFHTIVIDGINDFDPGETLATSDPADTGYIAYDDTHVYLGFDSNDLAIDSNLVWLVAYLGGSMGSTTGVNYNTQQPMLPFDARYHLQWRANDDFGLVLEYDMGWQPAPFNLEVDDVAVSGSFIEMRVARADIGDPAYLDLHLSMLTEEPLAELSWAAVPSTSFVNDTYDPDYTQYFQLDLQGSTLPADYLPM